MKKHLLRTSPIAAVAVYVALSLLVSSCAQKGTPKDTVVYSYLSNAGALNPHMYSPNQMYAQSMIYETLVKLKDDGTVGPALAESWDISPDGKEYIFHLRQGVKFQNGEAFNAAAVVKNFTAIMGNIKRHEWLGITDKIAGFEAAGDYDFKLTLKEPYYPALNDLSTPRPFTFLAPAAFPDDGDTSKGIKAVIGTGPWKLKESKLGEYDLFERYDDYWGGKPGPANVLVKVIPDPVSRAAAFESGEINLIYGWGQVNYDTFERLKNEKGITAEISKPMGTDVLAINSARAPTDELAVRQAIQYLTDKKEIISGVTQNTQIQADSYFSPTVQYCDVGLTPYPYDPAKAAAVLDAAGWVLPAGKTVREKNGVPLVIDLCFIADDASEKPIAEVLQGQASKVGVQFNLVGEEEASFYARQKQGNFGMIFNETWGPPYEPHAMISSMQAPEHGDYMAQSGLPDVDTIRSDIRDVLVTTDVNVRQALYKDLLTRLQDDAVYLPIYYLTFLEVHRTDQLQNVHFGTDQYHIYFEDMKVK